MKRILFVDDEERILAGLRRLTHAKRDEWTCIFASSVAEAVTYLDQGLDAIVTDLNMPGQTGIDLIRIVRSRQDCGRLPCVVLTGNGEAAAKKAAFDAGATDFLSKPVDFWELSARLENLVALKQYQDLVSEQRDSLDARVRQATLDLDQSRKNVILRLALAAEWRDENTGLHVLRVALLSEMLARGLGLDAETSERILLASPLHDVGKIAIPDAILYKSGNLDGQERDKMMTHCQAGFEILAGEHGGIFEVLGARADRGNDLLHCAALIAMTHHEWWDGTGYPHGLKGTEIPIEGRIVAVGDVFDALRSQRPYKDGFDCESTLRIMQEGSGKQFDPRIIEVLVEMSDEAEDILRRFASQGPSLYIAA